MVVRTIKNKAFIIGAFLIFSNFGCKSEQIDLDPINTVKKIADRVIRETIFDFQLVEKVEVTGLENVDFNSVKNNKHDESAYALSFIYAETDTLITFGISYTEEVIVWINNQKVFSGEKLEKATFDEFAYNRFHFDNSFTVKLSSGYNRVVVKTRSGSERLLFFLYPLDHYGNLNRSVRFTLENHYPALKNSSWLTIGPFASESDSFLTNNIVADEKRPFRFLIDGIYYTWKYPIKPLMKGFIIPDTFIYRRESYADWHYAIGAMNMVLLGLSDYTGMDCFRYYVEKYNDFILWNFDYSKYEYSCLGVFRGCYHRLIRACMLDDCGAPALSMLQMACDKGSDKYDSLILKLSTFIEKKQYRLEDGTFCRPEPYPNTIWADDLFMSVPFLLRMAKVKHNAAMYDDAALQIKNFYKYLFNPKFGIYKHGYFAETGKASVAHWARANGWVAWAVSDALQILPVDHKDYNEILNIFKKHMQGLRKFQDKSGLWHQLLDYPESYCETSASSMFVLAMARGIQNGWLDESFRKTVLEGWRGIEQKISNDGVVYGICQGTSIGETLQFYKDRATYPNDPRGLGAVIQAGIEVDKVIKTSNNF